MGDAGGREATVIIRSWKVIIGLALMGEGIFGLAKPSGLSTLSCAGMMVGGGMVGMAVLLLYQLPETVKALRHPERETDG